MPRLSIENVITWANAIGGWAVAWGIINLLVVAGIIIWRWRQSRRVRRRPYFYFEDVRQDQMGAMPDVKKRTGRGGSGNDASSDPGSVASAENQQRDRRN
jgi:hypothetical protein